MNSGVSTGGVSTAGIDCNGRDGVPSKGCGVAVGVALGACSVDEVATGAADDWFPRPLNSTSSALDDEASESAGEGLRIAMCAIAVVLSGVEEGEDGVFDSAPESDETWAVSVSGVSSFFSVPSR